MPDVTGLTSDEAVQVLEEAKLDVRSVDVFETDDEVGTVIAQLPVAGTEWKRNVPVAIGVAAGENPGTGVTVPDVVRESYDGAIAALAEEGLVGIGLVASPDELGEATSVLDQLPGSGVIVRQGTTVLLELDEQQ